MFSKIFGLQYAYNLTREEVEWIGGSLPAGVVDNSDVTTSKKDLISHLEKEILLFEKNVPYDITSQENIANLLCDVRGYIDFHTEK